LRLLDEKTGGVRKNFNTSFLADAQYEYFTLLMTHGVIISLTLFFCTVLFQTSAYFLLFAKPNIDSDMSQPTVSAAINQNSAQDIFRDFGISRMCLRRDNCPFL
jgi:hypothetical protein